jgi:hypothetical protein
MTDQNIKSLRFPISTDSKLESISLKLGRNKRMVFMQMVDYFHSSRKDPLDINDDVLKNTLLKSHKDYVGFIKAQESNLLVPIKKDVSRMIASQSNVINFFNKQVLEHNNSLIQNQEAQRHQFAKIDEVMRTIVSKLDTKEKLKREFLFILDNYIKTRESFGMMTSAKEKDELINKTRTFTNNL